MAETLVSRFDVGLFDLDGVCYLGQEAVEYARVDEESYGRRHARGLRDE